MEEKETEKEGRGDLKKKTNEKEGEWIKAEKNTGKKGKTERKRLEQGEVAVRVGYYRG